MWGLNAKSHPKVNEMVPLSYKALGGFGGGMSGNKTDQLGQTRKGVIIGLRVGVH